MRKTEPESARDMWWAQQQAPGSIGISYEATKSTPEEGALSHTEVSVHPSRYDDAIEVRKDLWYYGFKDEEARGWPMRVEVEWSHRMSFEEFRVSEWWGPYLEHTVGLNFDSSWMDSFQVDCQEGRVEARFDKPDYRKVWWCSGEVPTGGTTPYSAYVCDDGIVGIERGEEPTVERAVDEFLEAVRFADLAHELGVSISEDGTVTIGKGDSDAD